jgi:hypothetical protein
LRKRITTMTKIDAVSFSEAGDQFLGRSYDDMDCQEFVERCMAACGLKMDLGGSNSWYRECRKNGWTGTPEECMQLFGQIPKGALLFIWEPVSASTPEKFRKDGIGDLTHMGIKTGRGDGAIHSSHSKGGVVTSKFKDKTIPNGGWNRVGLYDKFDYGKSINWFLEHAGIGEPPAEKEGKPMQAVTYSEDGGYINLRAKTNTKSDRLAKIQPGQKVEVLGTNGEWTKVRWGGLTGWIMSEFLVADDSQLPAEDPNDFTPVDAQDQQGTQKVTLTFTVEELAVMLPILESMTSQIIEKVGRG